MTAHSDEPRKSPTLEALTELVNLSPTGPTPAQLSRGLNAVTSVMAVGRARQRLLVRLSLGTAMAVACAGVILSIVSWSRTHRVEPNKPALLFQTEGGSVIDGGYLRETGGTGITVSFSEGTKFSLTRGTRGRLRSVDSAGAHIAIDNGSGFFRVTPRTDAKWTVDAGPFLVTVKGTIFNASWDAPSERLEIRLQRGRVNVSGPLLGGEIALRPGQRLVVDLPKSETVITQDPPDADPVGSALVAAEPTEDLPGDRESLLPQKALQKSGSESSSSPSAVKSTQSRWGQAVAAADWDRILRDAEAAGVRSTLEVATSDDLFALADAARYRRRMGLAREALLAERRRFPSVARALDAAYLLGRVEESSERGQAEALKWYDEYLVRAPTGTYASEALGRKMILTNKLQGTAQAQPLAEAYLQRFPNGTYAGSARALRRVH